MKMNYIPVKSWELQKHPLTSTETFFHSSLSLYFSKFSAYHPLMETPFRSSKKSLWTFLYSYEVYFTLIEVSSVFSLWFCLKICWDVLNNCNIILYDWNFNENYVVKWLWSNYIMSAFSWRICDKMLHENYRNKTLFVCRRCLMNNFYSILQEWKV